MGHDAAEMEGRGVEDGIGCDTAEMDGSAIGWDRM